MSDSVPPPQHAHSIGDSLHHLGDSLQHLHMPHMHQKSVVRDVNAEHHQSMSALDRVALKINDYCGSMVTFLLVVAYETLWVLGVAIGLLKFDSLPNLPLLLVLLNLPQLPLMFALMVSGNMLNRHSELRAEADFAVNTQAEAQIQKLTEISNYQTEQILAIVKKLESSQPDVAAKV
jgi:uncharacterized membrane protein